MQMSRKGIGSRGAEAAGGVKHVILVRGTEQRSSARAMSYKFS